MIETLADNVATFWLTGYLSMPLFGVMLAGAYAVVIFMAFVTKCKPKIS